MAADFASPTWKFIDEYLARQLDQDRAKLEDTSTDERQSLLLRGRIEMVKRMRALPQWTEPTFRNFD